MNGAKRGHLFRERSAARMAVAICDYLEINNLAAKEERMLQKSIKDYRTFRARIIESPAVQRQIEDSWAKASVNADPWAYGPLPAQGLSYGRHVIHAFRSEVADTLGPIATGLSGPRLDSLLARRALRLPADVPLQLPRRVSAAFQLLWTLARMSWWRRVAARLRQIGTPQARRQVFRNYARTLWIDPPSYGDGLDFVLRHFALPISDKVLNDVAYLDLRSARNAWLLGVRNVETLKVFQDAWGRFPSEKLAVFIELGAIRTVEELAWLEPWRNKRDDGGNKVAGSAPVRRSMGRLLALGVPRQSMPKLLDFWGGCGLDDLNRSLVALAARGYTDKAGLFEALGESLWRARHARNWDFVIDVIGASEIREIALFDQLLGADTLPKPEVVHALLARGATLDDLAYLQSFLLTVSDRCQAPNEAIGLLMSEPHALSLRHLADCRGYVSQRCEDDLRSFLAYLARYGFRSADAVLSFQDAYRSWLAMPNIGRLLALHGGLRDAHTDPAVACAWICDVGEKYLDSLEYLVQALNISDRLAFQEIRPFARIAKSVLVWAVEERRLSTAEALRAWRRTSRGVEQVKAYEQDDPVFLLLLEDAMARGYFGHINRNMSAFWTAQWAEVETVLGRLPVEADQASRNDYWVRRSQLEAELCRRALPTLRHQLQATGGLLAKRLVLAAWKDAQAQVGELGSFNREVASLLDGQGPHSSELNELQADAISAVFGIDLRTDDARWAEVVGLDHHVEQLALRSYPMSFARQHVELKHPIDRKGLAAFVDAIHYGQNFREAISADVDRAWQNLSPKQMRQGGRVASMETLHRHLGVLLGMLPEAKSDALANEVEALGLESHEAARRKEAVRRLRDWFDVQLGDLLPQAVKVLAEQIGEVAAGRLARRLVDEPAHGLGMQDGLDAALVQTAARVRAVYGRWLYRQSENFSGTSESLGTREYRAVVSKHGAAYFSKVSADICSKENVAMWRESRHSHLLVFEMESRRLVAMAMLYVQRLITINAERPTLVMRAINTIPDVDMEHDADSIVQAFLAVGCQLAEANDLAAFAVPDDTDQHLLSNRNDIAACIKARCTPARRRRSERYDSQSQESVLPYAVRLDAREQFYGYEHGRAPVDTLYVLWAPPSASSLPGNVVGGLDRAVMTRSAV